MNEPKTFCFECRHFKDGGHWSRRYCGHPSQERKPHREPVMGEPCYIDASGTIYDAQHPLAREINRGDCPYFGALT